MNVENLVFMIVKWYEIILEGIPESVYRRRIDIYEENSSVNNEKICVWYPSKQFYTKSNAIHWLLHDQQAFRIKSKG